MKLELKIADYKTLRPKMWLNGQVINMSLRLMQARERRCRGTIIDDKGNKLPKRPVCTADTNQSVNHFLSCLQI